MSIYKFNLQRYTAKASKLLSDNDRVRSLLMQSREKLNSIIENNEKLREFTEQVSTLIRMIRAYFSGQYTELPWKSLIMFAAALIYFITPIDMIPDFIPALGFTDDVAIVYWVFRNFKDDIDRFKLWEQGSEAIVESHS